MPKVNRKCKIRGTGTRKKYTITLGDAFMKNTRATVRPMSRFKKLIITQDAGISSSGTLNCLHNPASSTSEVNDSCSEAVKQIQGNIPEMT